MAPYIFVRKILNNEKIQVFNFGNMERDFTYVEDIVQGIFLIMNGQKEYLNKIYNIGNTNPVNLNEFIKTIEQILSKKAVIEYLPMRQGDVKRTYADTTELQKDFGYNPIVQISAGLNHFVEWYKQFLTTSN